MNYMQTDTVLKKIVREVVKEELTPFEQKLDLKFARFKEEIISSLKELVAEYRNDVVQMKDEFVGEMRAMREEQTMLNRRTSQINEIDDRVEKLETIHPHHQHTAV